MNISLLTRAQILNINQFLLLTMDWLCSCEGDLQFDCMIHEIKDRFFLNMEF